MNAQPPVIAVVGLGYVGLPLALAFAEAGEQVIGFDINEDRIKRLRAGIDDTGENQSPVLKSSNIRYTSNEKELSEATFIIVGVPTPVNEDNAPDLTPVERASETIGRNLSKGATVVYESTVYPGVTEEICIPIIEKLSGLICGTDWKIGYSPERINPGDKEHTLKTVVKVVSGMDQESADHIAAVYRKVCAAGVHVAPSIKVAEAEKIVENIQRDVNIALINELATIFHSMGISTKDVIDAAATKWNFHRYTPGLVGGHCIGVDPFYMIHRAQSLSLEANLIAIARRINDGMAEFIAGQIVRWALESQQVPGKMRVLVAGLTFKEDVKDFRNSKAVDLIRALRSYGMTVDAYDPHYDDTAHLEAEDIQPLNAPENRYDVIVFPIFHTCFKEEFSRAELSEVLLPNGLVFSVKNALSSEDVPEGARYLTL